MQDPKAKIDLQKKQREDAEKLRAAFEEVAETGAGQIVLQFLMQKCYYQTSTISIDQQSGAVNTENVVGCEFLRLLYLRSIRPLIPVGIRRKIET